LEPRLRVERGAEPALHPRRDGLAQLGQALRRGVRRERPDGRGERLADEGRRLLARLAHAEVDQVGARGQQPLLLLGEAHERVRAHAGERGGEPHATNRSRTS
jgi:hypothetical protein